MQYNWDALFGDWNPSEEMGFYGLTKILSLGKNKVYFLSDGICSLRAEAPNYPWIMDLPYETKDNLVSCIEKRCYSIKEGKALDQLRQAGVIE